MAKIVVVAKIDAGILLKYGEIQAGKKYEIDEEDFGDQLFERPSPGWLSPHEKADRDRARELERTVGNQEYQEPQPEKPAGKQVTKPAVVVDAAAETKEV